MAEVRDQLVDDHVTLGKILTELQIALRRRDLQLAHDRLDLFWARLAVHIRAEHLHLFPAVLSRVENEAQKVVEQLRGDHDFFMHELARAVEVTRKLLTTSDESVIQQGLTVVRNSVLEIEQRLIKHNGVEESQVYGWTTVVLSSEEQAKLAHKITAELEKRPPRFTDASWSHVDDVGAS
jgi:hemerythrin superfamily protein